MMPIPTQYCHLFRLMPKFYVVIVVLIILSACGTLEKKSILLSPGDDKNKVLEVMGTPDDRQFQGKNEAWQYCGTGAGFGYHDYRIIWFYDSHVTGITSLRIQPQLLLVKGISSQLDGRTLLIELQKLETGNLTLKPPQLTTLNRSSRSSGVIDTFLNC